MLSCYRPGGTGNCGSLTAITSSDAEAGNQWSALSAAGTAFTFAYCAASTGHRLHKLG